MSKRITWQNVDAPRFGDAIAATNVAGNMLGQGFAGAGTAVEDFQTSQQEKASAAAAAEMLKYTDATQWDAAMKGGGLKALGLPAHMATPDLLSAMTSRRGDLLADDNMAADTMGVEARTAASIDSHKWSNKQNQYNWDKAIKADDTAEATRVLNEEALSLATKLNRDNSLVTAEDRDRAVLAENLDPKMQTAVMAAMGSLPDRRGISTEAQAATANMPVVNGFKTGLDQREQDIQIEVATSPVMSTYARGASTFGENNSNPVGTIKERLREDFPGSDEEFSSSLGDLQGSYTRLQEEYPALPPMLIAQVMRENLKEDQWFAGWRDGGKLDVDFGAAGKILKEFSKEGSLQQIRTESSAVDGSIRSINEQRRKFESAENAYQIALTKRDEPGMERAMKAMADIAQKSGVVTEGDGGRTGDGIVNAGTGRTAPPGPGAMPVDPVTPTLAGMPDGRGIVNAAQQGAPAPAPMPLDPRIVATNAGIEDFGRGVVGGTTDLARGAGKTVKGIGGLYDKAAQGFSDTLARGVGVIAPETGSAMLQANDDFRAGTGEITPTPPSMPDIPASSVTSEWASSNPVEALNVVAAETGLSPSRARLLEQVATSLQTGVNPTTGLKLTAAERAKAKEDLKGMVEAMRFGNGRGPREELPAFDAVIKAAEKQLAK